MSIGADRIRLNFNPSQDNLVDKIKTLTSNLIDECEELKKRDPRLAALAQTAYEEACMWAVKAATTPPMKKIPNPSDTAYPRIDEVIERTAKDTKPA